MHGGFSLTLCLLTPAVAYELVPAQVPLPAAAAGLPLTLCHKGGTSIALNLRVPAEP